MIHALRDLTNRLVARELTAHLYVGDGQQVCLHASVGVALAPANQLAEPRDLLYAADLAMYRAKPARRAARA